MTHRFNLTKPLRPPAQVTGSRAAGVANFTLAVGLQIGLYYWLVFRPPVWLSPIGLGAVLLAVTIAIVVVASFIEFVVVESPEQRSAEQREQACPHPSRYLIRAEEAVFSARWAEAIASYEAYLHARGGLSEDSQSEFVLRRIALLYLMLNKPSDSIRECERLAAHYYSKQPPDLRKASAIARLILKIDPKNQRALEWFRG